MADVGAMEGCNWEAEKSINTMHMGDTMRRDYVRRGRVSIRGKWVDACAGGVSSYMDGVMCCTKMKLSRWTSQVE